MLGLFVVQWKDKHTSVRVPGISNLLKCTKKVITCINNIDIRHKSNTGTKYKAIVA